MSLPAGTMIDARYRVLDRLGTGGMADVYLAEDQHLDRRVAVKILHPRFARDADFVQRFRREASAAAGLQHKNVVNIFDRGETAGTYYIAMEYLAGRSLKDVIRTEAPMAPGRAIDLALQILAAARFAHSKGVIHRDFKPQNIVVDQENNVKVTDFGIALSGNSDMTAAGEMLGTVHYLSPEQAQGRDVAATSDIYSIGVVLYEMLTGRVPFDGDSSVAIALKHVNEPAPVPSVLAPGAPAALDAVVARALAKDPAHRFADAAEFSEALKKVAAGLTAPAPTAVGDKTAVYAAPTVVSPPTEARAAAAAGGSPPAGSATPASPSGKPPAATTPTAAGGKRKRWPWIIGVIALVAIAGAALAIVLTPTKVVVPYVIGRSLSDARAELTAAGLESKVVRRRDPAPAGEVIDQDPERDARVNEGSPVLLTVSDGPGTVKMPEVAGLKKKRAVERLEQLGLNVVIQREYSVEAASGNATHTVPAAGETVERGSDVDLFISRGARPVKVPSVVGMTLADAKSELADAGFEVDVNKRDSSEKEDEVLEQDPAAGTELSEGDTVDLVVASGANTVPDVVDLAEDTAIARLRDAGFEVEVGTIEVTEADQNGIVQSMSPDGGTLELGETVTITVGEFTS